MVSGKLLVSPERFRAMERDLVDLRGKVSHLEHKLEIARRESRYTSIDDGAVGRAILTDAFDGDKIDTLLATAESLDVGGARARFRAQVTTLPWLVTPHFDVKWQKEDEEYGEPMARALNEAFVMVRLRIAVSWH